jgi:hypothetical protein
MVENSLQQHSKHSTHAPEGFNKGENSRAPAASVAPLPASACAAPSTALEVCQWDHSELHGADGRQPATRKSFVIHTSAAISRGHFSTSTEPRKTSSLLDVSNIFHTRRLAKKTDTGSPYAPSNGLSGS